MRNRKSAVFHPVLLSVAWLAGAGGLVLAQDSGTDPPNSVPSRGLSPGGQYALSQIESVNAITGGLSLSIPVAHLPPGPGGFTAGLNLIYNSSIYDIVVSPPGVGTTTDVFTYQPSSHGGGWNYGYQYTLWAQPRVSTTSGLTSAQCEGVAQTELQTFFKNYLTTPDGNSHVLSLVGTIDSQGSHVPPPSGIYEDSLDAFVEYDFSGNVNPYCTNLDLGLLPFLGTLVFATSDSTYIRVEANTVAKTWVAFLPDGTQVSGPFVFQMGGSNAAPSDNTLITDRNNNTLTVSGSCSVGQACQGDLTDQFGRKIAIDYANSAGNWQDTISWLGVGGAALTTTVNWEGNCLGSTTDVPCTAQSASPEYCAVTDYISPYTQSCGTPETLSAYVTSVPAVASVQLPASSATGAATTFSFGYYYSTAQQNSLLLSWGEVHSIGMCTSGCSGGQTLCASGGANCQQWSASYQYLFDQMQSFTNYTPATPRAPGTGINPVSSKLLTYNELRDGSGSTAITEPTTYSFPIPNSPFTYPTAGTSVIAYPDGSTSQVSTANLCSSIASRDYCPAVPYQTINRDGSSVTLGWATNSPPSNLAAASIFNPYVQYSVSYPVAGGASASPPSATHIAQDQNGNVTTLQEYDWLSGSPTIGSSGFVTAIPGTPLRTTNSQYWWSVDSAPPYWQHWQSGTIKSLRARYCMSIVAGAGAGSCTSAGNVYEQYTYDNPLTTANIQTLQQWDSGNSQTIGSHWTYTSNGNVASSADPNGNVTNIAYDSNGLYPTQAVTAYGQTVARTFSYAYDFNSGFQTQQEDVDNSVTTSSTYDNLGRQLTAQQTGGVFNRTTTTSYDDTKLGVTVTDPDTSSTTYYDALGRVRYAVNSAAGINVQKAYRYGSNVSYELESNPYTSLTSDQTAGWTLTTRDPAGRVTNVTDYRGSAMPSPWGGNASNTGTTLTAYAGNSGTPCAGFNVHVTDEASNTHVNCLDGLGRLAAVQEPSGAVTSYSYDLQNNLIGVSVPGQSYSGCTGGQFRCFTYSTLSRLLSAANPESSTATSGTAYPTKYTYDANGNLLTRTDAIGNVTTMTYDRLNRPTGVGYTVTGTTVSTPSIAYGYDTDFKGALSSVSNGSATSYTHDGLGRIAASTQTTGGVPYSFSYRYSLTDQLTSITYPSGRVVTYALDGADRVTSVQNATAGANYASNIQYTASGGITGMTMGNGLTHTLTWNDRLQPTGLTVNNSSASLLGLAFYPCTSSATYCASGNNGNLQSQAITIPSLGILTQTYSYNNLNQLTGASENSGAWSQNYGYDVNGNRWVLSQSTNLPSTVETPAASTAYSSSAVPNRANACVTYGVGCWTYDSNGNILSIYMGTSGTRSFTYDAENRQVSANINGTVENYAYDGNGLRVGKTPSGGSATVYVYDAWGNLAAEYGPTEVSPCGTATCYLALDHLGSTRMLTDSSGNAQRRYDYLPFGQEILAGVDGRSTGYQTSPDDTNPKFTGQLRDVETGNDWFLARYYSGAQGRFTSIDPEGVGSTRGAPQSWNMYAYVGNNPLRYTDPFGLNYDVCNSQGQNCATLTDEQYQQYLASIQNSGVYVTPSGQINYQNADGSVTNIGSAGYYNERAENAAAFLNWTLTQMSLNAVFQGARRAAGALVGRAFEAVTSGRVAGAAAEDAIASSPVGRRGAPIDIAPGTNAGTKIGDRWYTGHALDQMQGRGAVPSVVEDTISTGTKSPGNLPNTIKYSTSQADVVTNTRGDVVTVIVKSGK